MHRQWKDLKLGTTKSSLWLLLEDRSEGVKKRTQDKEDWRMQMYSGTKTAKLNS